MVQTYIYKLSKCELVNMIFGIPSTQFYSDLKLLNMENKLSEILGHIYGTKPLHIKHSECLKSFKRLVEFGSGQVQSVNVNIGLLWK